MKCPLPAPRWLLKRAWLYARLWLNIHRYLFWIRRLAGLEERRRMAKISERELIRGLKTMILSMDMADKLAQFDPEQLMAMAEEIEAVYQVLKKLTAFDA